MSAKGKLKKMLKRRDAFYAKKRVSHPDAVASVQRAILKAVAAHSHKTYRRDRDRAERFIRKLFRKYGLLKTNNEEYWRLWCIDRLLGPSPEIRRIAKIVERKHRSKRKARSKFRNRKHKQRR